MRLMTSFIIKESDTIVSRIREFLEDSEDPKSIRLMIIIEDVTYE